MNTVLISNECTPVADALHSTFRAYETQYIRIYVQQMSAGTIGFRLCDFTLDEIYGSTNTMYYINTEGFYVLYKYWRNFCDYSSLKKKTPEMVELLWYHILLRQIDLNIIYQKMKTLFEYMILFRFGSINSLFGARKCWSVMAENGHNAANIRVPVWIEYMDMKVDGDLTTKKNACVEWMMLWFFFDVIDWYE